MKNNLMVSSDDAMPLGAEGFSEDAQRYVQSALRDVESINLRPVGSLRRIADRLLNLVGRGSVYLSQQRHEHFKYTR